MREEELVSLIRKIQRRQTEFQTVELKTAQVDFPKKIYDTQKRPWKPAARWILMFGRFLPRQS